VLVVGGVIVAVLVRVTLLLGALLVGVLLLVRVLVLEPGDDGRRDDGRLGAGRVDHRVDEGVVAAAVLDHELRVRDGELVARGGLVLVRVLLRAVDDARHLDEVAADALREVAVHVRRGDDRDEAGVVARRAGAGAGREGEGRGADEGGSGEGAGTGRHGEPI
jgi:hypothetical protein